MLAACCQSVTGLRAEAAIGQSHRLADRLTVLVYGRAIATGTPQALRANDAVQRAYLGDEAE